MKQFADPIRDKASKKTTHSYWQHKQPQYDERSSCYINAGTDHKVGYKQPVGHHGDANRLSDVLPQHVMTIDPRPNPNDAIVE